MNHREFCARCRWLGLGQFRASGRATFFLPQASPHYAPDLPLKLEHIKLEVTVDPVGKTLKGTATQTLRAIAPGEKGVAMDQIGLKIRETRAGGQKVAFSIEGGKLRIPFAKPLAEGQTIDISVDYDVQNPQRGLYFTGPDADHPEKPYQVWSQGQDEDNRHWFPTLDYPNQKATSEIIATVPKGYTAISNGALLSKKDSAAGTEFHYKLGTPHVTYLIALTVGQFTEWQDKGPRGLPLQYFVPVGTEADGKRAYENTRAMVEAFEKRVGEPYPYEKYSQVSVQDFIFGGMENTSATTMSDMMTLHDERAHLDFSADGLVAHELAHQWFGDLLTCRDWSHGWLNEGFATFMERIWVEEDTGPHGGWEEAKYYALNDLRAHLAEDQGKYRRPIVCNTYVEPIDLFDTHLYHKAGLVLNLVRSILGKDAFWKSISLYVKRHRGGSVETIDLIRAIEDATGRNLRRVFDEWIFGAGYPEMEATYSWNEEKKQAEIVIEQKQTGGKPFVDENGARTHLFHLPLVIELTLEGDKKVTRKIDIGEARERIFIDVSSKPLMVRVDPDHTIPKTLKFPRPKELLIYQLEKDTDSIGRIEAAHELAKLIEADIVPALAKAARGDSFWAVQAEACDALSEVRSEAARDALIEVVRALAANGNPKARRAAVRALGTYKDAKASEALRKLAEKDPSYFVEADATWAWAESSLQPGRVVDADGAEKFLLAQLSKSSYRDVIRTGALRGLAFLPGIGRGERPKAFQTLIDWTARAKSIDARVAAIVILGRVGRHATPAERGRIVDLFTDLADEPNFRTRVALVRASGELDHPDGLGVLAKIRRVDLDGRVRRESLVTSTALSTAGAASESVANLKESLTKLEEEYRKLRTLVEESRSSSPKP